MIKHINLQVQKTSEDSRISVQVDSEFRQLNMSLSKETTLSLIDMLKRASTASDFPFYEEKDVLVKEKQQQDNETE